MATKNDNNSQPKEEEPVEPQKAQDVGPTYTYNEFNLADSKEFAISKEIVATETDGGELHLVNEQSKSDVELVDFESWLASYLDTNTTYTSLLSNAKILGEPTEDCQSFFDTPASTIDDWKDKRFSRRS